jgi:hypothetical protein
MPDILWKSYTVWHRDEDGVGHKEFHLTRKRLKEFHAELSQKHGDLLIWPGNWFGLAPGNQPAPDDQYGIPEDKR